MKLEIFSLSMKGTRVSFTIPWFRITDRMWLYFQVRSQNFFKLQVFLKFSKNVGILRKVLWLTFTVTGLFYSIRTIQTNWTRYMTYPSSIKPAYDANEAIKFPKGDFVFHKLIFDFDISHNLSKWTAQHGTDRQNVSRIGKC